MQHGSPISCRDSEIWCTTPDRRRLRGGSIRASRSTDAGRLVCHWEDCISCRYSEVAGSVHRSGTESSLDSPLEGNEFELPVPREIAPVFSGLVVVSRFEGFAFRSGHTSRRAGAGYVNAGGGTKPPISAASSRANSIIVESSPSGPIICRPAGSPSPVKPMGAAVAGRYDRLASPAKNNCSDELLSRFWVSPRSVDTHNRERQLAVDFIVSAAGGPTIYLGRDMRMSHKGMGITKADYAAFMRCLSVTLDTFAVPEPERSEVVAFTTSLESEIVEA
jgi:hemoglobin